MLRSHYPEASLGSASSSRLKNLEVNFTLPCGYASMLSRMTEK
jgi:hypothetical protein